MKNRSYLSLIPRGLQYVVKEMVEESLSSSSSSSSSWDVHVDIQVGEENILDGDGSHVYDSDKSKGGSNKNDNYQHMDNHTKQPHGDGININYDSHAGENSTRPDNSHDGKANMDATTEAIQQKVVCETTLSPNPAAATTNATTVAVATGKKAKKRMRREICQRSTCLAPVGQTKYCNHEVSLGYHSTCRRGGGLISALHTIKDNENDASRRNNTSSCQQQKDDAVSSPQEVSTQPVWSIPGRLTGLVWMRICTNAPIQIVTTKLRCLGPLLALVGLWDNTTSNSKSENKTSISSSRSYCTTTHHHLVNLSDNLSLQETKEEIGRMLMDGDTDRGNEKSSQRKYISQLDEALQVWMECVEKTWNLSPKEVKALTDKVLAHKDEKEGKRDMMDSDGTNNDNTTPIQPGLRYRLSCMRDESKKYKFTRQELLSSIAEVLVPAAKTAPTDNVSKDNESGGAHRFSSWVVDLNHYDLEIVVLMRSRSAMAIGIPLRPYRQVGAKSFYTGSPPPDIAPPYLSGQVLCDLVKLRPSTAQVLLHLAQIQVGDIVLDPCAGIGTIPIETMFCAARNAGKVNGGNYQSQVVVLGGDLVLTPSGLAPLASSYAKQAQQVNLSQGAPSPSSSSMSSSTKPDLMGWDACYVPLRSGCIDVIVSDLPFGQRCLSSSKLEEIIPLMLEEMARVLRPGTGRMVLLCGSYVPILEVLEKPNADNNTNDNGSTNGQDNIWSLPCSAVFPVNIGGLLAWVVCVSRGTKTYSCSTVDRSTQRRHIDRVRKLTKKRDRIAHLHKKQDYQPKRMQKL